jgi:hypothetical protein
MSKEHDTDTEREREEMIRMLEDLLHQLSTDSDLEDKVSRPDKYEALTADLRELVERVTGRTTTCHHFSGTPKQ